MNKSPDSNLNREADALQRTIEEQRNRIAELEAGKAWLEEQWNAWKETAEERERSIEELKAWIDQLEAGRAWLEKDRQYWKGVAMERRIGIYELALHAARRFSPRWKKEESSDLAAATDGGSWSPQNWPVQPVRREMGHDHGKPLDQYYIEKFLEKYLADIQGRVLEIGDTSFTLRYGGSRVEKSEMLNVTQANSLTAILANLAQADLKQFDCIILTQRLHSMPDQQWALKALHRLLKPCGVLLAVFPGINRSSLRDVPSSDYWSLTSSSVRRLFGDVFQNSNVVVEAYGNVLTTSAFLYGFSADELRQEDLEYRDPEYDLLITVRARKDQLAEAERHGLKLQRKAGSTEDRALILLYHSVIT